MFGGSLLLVVVSGTGSTCILLMFGSGTCRLPTGSGMLLLLLGTFWVKLGFWEFGWKDSQLMLLLLMGVSGHVLFLQSKTSVAVVEELLLLSSRVVLDPPLNSWKMYGLWSQVWDPLPL